jgi:serine/threonine protein kinase
VHRDIKPSNVLFSEGDAPVLTDFGIATTIQGSTHLTATGMTLGSIEYMSPEQAAGDRVDERADLYSLGVLLWQLLTGRLPYEAPNALALARCHLEDPVPRLPPDLAGYQGLIDALLAKAPRDRPPSARALQALLGELPTAPDPHAGRRGAGQQGADQQTRRLSQVPESVQIAAKAPPVQTNATRDMASDRDTPDPPTRLSAATTALAAAAALLLVVSYTALWTGP